MVSNCFVTFIIAKADAFGGGPPPDGYTVLVGASGAMAIGPLIFKTNYETLKSFTPVTMRMAPRATIGRTGRK